MAIDPAELLRQRGFKVTAQRLAVLRAVAGRPHLTADDVVEVVRGDIGTISRRAVYDAVGVLADMGLLRRIQPAGSAARYEDRAGDNHHHLICRSCGSVTSLDNSYLDSLATALYDEQGFQADIGHFAIFGLCRDCR